MQNSLPKNKVNFSLSKLYKRLFMSDNSLSLILISLGLSSTFLVSFYPEKIQDRLMETSRNIIVVGLTLLNTRDTETSTMKISKDNA